MDTGKPKTLAEALLEIQKSVTKEGGLVKSKENPFTKSMYADLHTVTQFIYPRLNDFNIVVSHVVRVVGDIPVLTTRFLHLTSKEELLCDYPLRPSKENDPQGL